MARPKKIKYTGKKRGRKPFSETQTEGQKKVAKLKDRLLMVLFLTQEELKLTDDEVRFAILGLLDCNCNCD